MAFMPTGELFAFDVMTLVGGILNTGVSFMINVAIATNPFFCSP
jgi:hypothetical protein